MASLGKTLLWQLPGKAPREFAEQNFNFVPVTLSPDGRVLALSEEMGTGITLWDAGSGKPLHRLDMDRSMAEALAFSPDGTLVAAAGKDQVVRLWKVATGQVYRRLPKSSDRTFTLAFTPDSRSLITGGKDGKVQLWELFTGTQQRELGGHRGNVLGVAVSPDGRLVASAGADRSVLLQDLTPRARREERLTEEQLAALWMELADGDATRADRAAVKLIESSQAAVPFLREKLRPVPALKEQELRNFLVALEHRSFAVRQRAERQLQQLGVVVRPALQRILADRPTLETRRRLERLLDTFDEDLLTPGELRAWRAVGVLERMRSPAARRLLVELAGGAPGAWQTEAARRALTVQPPAPVAFGPR